MKITVPIPEGDHDPEVDALKNEKPLGNPVAEDKPKSIGSEVFTEDMKKAQTEKPQTVDQMLTEHALTIRQHGHDLMAAALYSQRSKFNEKLVMFVTGTLDQLDRLEDQKKNLDKCITVLKNRLQAINNGEFKVDQRGNIAFDNQELNAGTPAQVEAGRVFVPMASLTY